MKHARQDYMRFQEPEKLLGLIDKLMAHCRDTIPAGLVREVESAVALYPAPVHEPFGEDEPVFLLRAKDALFVPMLEAYGSCLEDHPDEEMAERMTSMLNRQIEVAEDWQATHETKAPDVPTSEATSS